MSEPTIDTVLNEKRVFPPSEAFRSKAALGSTAEYERMCAEGANDPVAFWEKAAKQLHWFTPWDRALEWKEPFAKWFIGGKINAAYNCLDRHLDRHGEKLALIWEGEDGSTVRWTYRELHAHVCRMSAALENRLGLRPGDTAAIYMPLVPEAVVAMLACARVGVTHSVIFAGFSAHAIRDRVNDAGCRAVLTCDVGYRRGQVLDLQGTVRAAVTETPSVEHVVVLRRKGSASPLGGREIDWVQLCEGQPANHPARELDAEHPLFMLYTSGTTGKPKGIVHSTGGYLTGAATTAKLVFDLKDGDTYWCTADIGWVTGHSYLVYGILANAATAVIYEGNLMHPHPARIWEIVDKHRVTILYTAPTAIRAFMRAGEEHPRKWNLDTLRLLGTVGEPINPEAWMWYRDVIGRGRCPIVDTWWQTETGSILIAPLPGVTPTKPGSATRALPGIAADIVDEQGKSCPAGAGGYLVITHPWPSMLRGIHGDPARYREQYWSRFPGKYFTGDGANRDADGYFWIKGRVDDVLNVSGHRLGTMEIESALVSHPAVAEAAVVGRPDELKGQAVVAFVIPRDGYDLGALEELRNALKSHVTQEIGSIARPDDIRFTKTLPKTRSGKIMRRLLKDLAAGRTASGDTTTLENPGLVELIE